MILLVISLILGVAWLKKDIHIQTNVFALLPKLSQDAQLERTQQYVAGQLNQTVFLVLDAKTPAQMQQATQSLQQSLQHNPLFTPLKPQADVEQIGRVMYQHRDGLLSPEDQALLQKQDYAALTEKSLLQLMTPGMPVTAEGLTQDPFMLFSRYLMANAQHLQSSNIELENGFATLHEPGKISRLFTLNLSKSPYNIDYQEQVSAWIDTTRQQLNRMQVTSHWTGTLLFANYGTQSAKQEIPRLV